MWKRLFVSLVLAILLVSVGFAEDHDGNKEKQKDLSYSISYLGYRFTSEDYFAQYNYSKVPSYYVFDTMHFSVTITNNGKKTLKNLKVQTLQYHYPDVLLPGNSTAEWAIEKLKPGQSITLEGSFYIGSESIPYAGLDNTRLIITKGEKHDDEDEADDDHSDGKTKIIVDDQFAGIWCPLAIFKSILPISP